MDKVKIIEHTTIETRDGTKLAAKIWTPEDAKERPVPAIFEYIPYRKRDGSALRDSKMHPLFAQSGYACVRVDIRGSGDSEGVLEDEYLESELRDGEDVINWISEQEWCDGQVSMMGISWGGFNGLMLAARRPKPLKSIITICSTDDRYADDIHYIGGCMLGENFSWASTMFAYVTSPPDPALAGPKWKDMWLNRLQNSGLWIKKWLEHQKRDDYWKHGSVCEEWSDIEIPVFAVCGWADGYSNSVFRLLKNLKGPRMGLIGPWSHKYPHEGVPGPAIDFISEATRWFDHWMKGRDNGMMEEPMLRAWMQDSMPPSTGYAERPGRWVGENSWPSPNVKEETFYFTSQARLEKKKDLESRTFCIHSPFTVGLFSGKWCSESSPPDLPDDQREEDGGSLVFETEPVGEDLEILGQPYIDLEFKSDQPVAMVAVRLSNVLPDGKATRVTYGLLNLTHRNDHERPEPLEPGETYKVRVTLNEVAQKFPKGDAVRVSISTSYWPHAWTPPRPVTLKINSGGCRLVLPARVPRDEDKKIQISQDLKTAPPMNIVQEQKPLYKWRVIRDLGEDSSVLEVIRDKGQKYFPEFNWRTSTKSTEHYFLTHDDLSTIKAETHWVREFERDDWKTKIITRTTMTSDKDNFYIYAQLDAYENSKRVHSKTWNEKIQRNLV